MANRLRKFVSAVATTAVVATAFALSMLGVAMLAGYQPQVVKSGSMDPMLARGSLIFVKATPPESLEVGQVVTFENPLLGGKNTVTHRIVAVKRTPQGLVFATKGDANQSRDPWLVRIDDTAGLYRFEIPYAGQLSFIVHSRNGYIALFALPLLLIALMTLWRIWKRPERQDAGNQQQEIAWLGDPAHS